MLMLLRHVYLTVVLASGALAELGLYLKGLVI